MQLKTTPLMLVDLKLDETERKNFKDGFVLALYDWECETKISPDRVINRLSDRYTALYTPEQAEQFLAWLKEHGIETEKSNA